MYDMLPFPNITATDPREQASQINNYLIQFKETLEFILTNISVDNLSAELIDKLNSLGAEVEKTQVDREEELQQVSNRMITVSDVVNSEAFKASTVGGVKVNGEVLAKDSGGMVDVPVPDDYIVSGSQTTTSTEDGGENVYTFTKADGAKDTFRCRNGSKGEKGDKGEKGEKGDKGENGTNGTSPVITVSVNMTTGHLTYTSS